MSADRTRRDTIYFLGFKNSILRCSFQISEWLFEQMGDTEFAKVHLREHLGGLIVPPISEGFWSIYTSSKDLCERNGQIDQTIRTFQNMLTRIPEWSDTTLATEVDRILKVSKCTYMDDLIMGVFIAYMKSFASLHYRGNSSQIKIEFERPSVAKFIHELYKHSARKLWQVAYLFRTVGTTSEQQARNRQDIEKIISDCMEQVIRAFLPWEAIAKNYFVDAPTDVPVVQSSEPATKTVTFEEDDESSSDEEEEDDAPPPKLNLSEETDTIEVKDLDEKPQEVTIPETPVDPLKEIESKVEEGESLVLNL